jgi:medium-chain acyl-[acyl-carrier-protein] hydrolase
VRESGASTPWIVEREIPRQDDLRLVCLPYAGGSAAIYRTWPALVPQGVSVRAVELPGRGGRFQEAPFLRLPPLVEALAEAVQAEASGPYALFGHSMGGLLAFEVTRALRRRGGLMPVHLFISSAASPAARSLLPTMHTATDTELIRYLTRLNGTPREVLANDELMDLLIPVLRADFAVLETHVHQEEDPLDIPLTVFGGTSDRIVRPAALLGWRRQSRAWSRLRMFGGDHFYLHDLDEELVAEIVQDLTPHLQGR